MKERFLTVIPVLDEEDNIEQVVDGAIKYTDVCVVNDASRDKTGEILALLQEKYKNRLFVIRHEKNTHIPAAIQDGMKFAVANHYHYVITMDAGLAHDPEMLPGFMSHSPCDLLIGRRDIVKNIPIYRRVLSFFAARIMNYGLSDGFFDFFGPEIKDCTSGFRRYSYEAFSMIAGAELESISHDFQMEALYLVYSQGGAIDEFSIFYQFPSFHFDKKIFKQALQYAKKLLYRKFGFKA